jgi:uncharacterized membrane protein
MNGLSRIWAIALLISLAANLFIAGMLISSWAFDGPQISGRQFAIERFQSRNHRDPIVGQIIGKFGSKLRPHIQKVQTASKAVGMALIADPFDEQSLLDALDHLQVMTEESQKAMHVAMIQTVRAMSPSQRRELVEESMRNSGMQWLGR